MGVGDPPWVDDGIGKTLSSESHHMMSIYLCQFFYVNLFWLHMKVKGVMLVIQIEKVETECNVSLFH